jgi:hypothetical protein
MATQTGRLGIGTSREESERFIRPHGTEASPAFSSPKSTYTNGRQHSIIKGASPVDVGNPKRQVIDHGIAFRQIANMLLKLQISIDG